MRIPKTLIVLSLVGFGCQAEPEAAAPGVVSTPLAFDPTESYDYTGWWSNGFELLRLDQNDAFRFYDSMNPHAQPDQRGVWSLHHYALMRLEPYSRYQRQPVRVRIQKTTERITLTIPGLRPMIPIVEPPLVVEDRLMGTWNGERIELLLQPGMAFVLREARPDISPNAVVSRRGTWHVEESEIVLVPDAPNATTRRLPFEETEDTVNLSLHGEQLKHPGESNSN